MLLNIVSPTSTFMPIHTREETIKETKARLVNFVTKFFLGPYANHEQLHRNKCFGEFNDAMNGRAGVSEQLDWFADELSENFDLFLDPITLATLTTNDLINMIYQGTYVINTSASGLS